MIIIYTCTETNICQLILYNFVSRISLVCVVIELWAGRPWFESQ